MIRVTETDSGKVARVDGAVTEVMLFYCFWQSSLWPDWAHHLKSENLGSSMKALADQVKMVLSAVKDGDKLLLSDTNNSVFEKARKSATQSCRNVGIEVSVNGFEE